MGLFDKIKGAVNSVTGGGAKVTMQFDPPVAMPGQQVRVKITATSTGADIESKGMYVDLRGTERITLNRGDAVGLDRSLSTSKHSFEQEFPISQAFKIPANQTVEFEGTFVVPPQVEPTFRGKYAEHAWEIRGRVEAFGNDPDTGYLPFMVGRGA